ncbi:hypothetical protein L204_102508 [Cryptococcus depauperatus]|nr:DNA polymerase sigma subunit [Cryptococcus depauperatus CBS 7855]
MEELALPPAESYISFAVSPPPSATLAESSGKGKRKATDTPAAGETKSKKKKGNKKKHKSPSQSQPDQPQAEKKQKKDRKAKELQKELERAEAKRAARGKKPSSAGATGPRNRKEEKRAAERHAPWTELVDFDRCRDPADLLTEEIHAFYHYVSPTRAEFEVRLFIIELITQVINKLWPDAEVFPFGSWLTQLYLPQGDIDLVVSHKGLSDSNKQRLLAELGKALRQADITDVVAIIAKARVPIIKFVTLEGKINVDISLNTTNGVSAGKIINQYLDLLPGSRQLILVVKSFLSQRSMNEVYTGGLGSYAVICMVISFLQLHPKLRRAEINPQANLGTLLIEFFELYGRNFNYNDVGLSVRRGGFYFNKASRGWMKNQSFLLSIEDPQDKDNDISGGSFGIRQVRNTLAGAYELLSMRLFERAAQMSLSRSTLYAMDGDEWSILGGVMGITKESLKQRAELKRIHDEAHLHKKLDIPKGADPAKYIKNYRPPPATNLPSAYGRVETSPPPLPNTVSTKADETDDVNAIMVEDDELSSGTGDTSDSDEDEEDCSSDSTHPIPISPPLRHTAANEVISLPSTPLMAPPEKKPLGDSEPSEDDIEIIDEPEESRYALSKTKSLAKANVNAFTKSLPVSEEEDSDEEALRKIMEGSDYDQEEDNEGGKDLAKAIEVGDSSDDHIMQYTEQGNENEKQRARKKRWTNEARKRKAERRAFWAAKGNGFEKQEEWSD